jgi:hypothetical protein
MLVFLIRRVLACWTEPFRSRVVAVVGPYTLKGRRLVRVVILRLLPSCPRWRILDIILLVRLVLLRHWRPLILLLQGERVVLFLLFFVVGEQLGARILLQSPLLSLLLFGCL